MNGVDAYHNGYTHNGHHPLETPDSFTASPADPNEYPPGPVDSSLHVKRQRSMKFSLYPARPRTSSREPTRADTVSPITPMTSQRQASIHRHPTNSPQTEPQHNTQRPVTSHDRPSNDSYRLPQTSLTNATYNTSTKSISNAPHSVQKRPSEASRLRALNNGHHSSRSPDGRRTPDRSRTPENFSRPRAPSIKRGNEPPKPLLQNANTFPLPAYDEEQTPTQWSANVRDRGLSTSSSQSNINNYPTRPLRASSSIPDYHAPDSLYSRQRNLSNTNYSRPARGHPPPDNSAIANRHDPIPRSNGLESDEVRASFRSALTTNSSYVGTSGTERSSVMTRSSSATSVYGKDEGMSVDDAIGMYSGGFVDSEVEDHHGTTRPPTANSERVTTSRDEGAMGTVSPEPQSRPIIRDSSAIFQLQTHVATGETHSSPPEDLHLQPQGGGLKPTRLQEAYTPVNEEVKADIDRDRYGFRKKTQYITSEQYDAWNGPYTEYLARRRKKWVALLKDSDLPTQNPMRFPAKSAKIKRFVRKGIPPEWRGEAWFYYAGGSAMVAKHYGVYEDLVSKAAAGAVAETDNEIIERDLNRTFPDNVKFKPDVPEGDGNAGDGHPPFEHPETPVLQSLRRVLQAFSIYNPKIGYCQSLNFLAGLLLLFMDEEKSFWMLNIITRVYLPGTHEVNLEGANVDLGVLMTSIKETMPAIWGKIGGELDGTAGDDKVSMRLPPITLCCTAWFMSCFIGTLPIETTLRVWDSFFLEGSKTLFRIALAIFKVGEQEIRAVSDPMEIFQVVQTIPRRLIDVNALVDVCFFRRRNGFGHLSQATIETRRAERRAGYAEERAIANGDVVLARKGTLFSRKRLK